MPSPMPYATWRSNRASSGADRRLRPGPPDAGLVQTTGPPGVVLAPTAGRPDPVAAPAVAGADPIVRTGGPSGRVW
jgi:hypothetical protein